MFFWGGGYCLVLFLSEGGIGVIVIGSVYGLVVFMEIFLLFSNYIGYC